MDLYVKDIYGFSDASIQLPTGALLITGKNSAGKTSVSKILAALLAHDQNPSKITATEFKHYVRDGALEGYAELDGVKWVPKTGIAAPPKQAPKCSPYAVGLVDFRIPRSSKKRQEIWESLFIPSNPRELLEPVWTLPKKQLDAVLDAIEKNGGDWNVAYGYYNEQRLEWQRKWQATTGSQRYGVKIASSWTPKMWSPELEGASKEQLQAELVDARDALRMMVSQQAITASQIEEAKTVRDVHLPKAERALEAVQEQVTEVRKNVDEQSAEIKSKKQLIADAQEWMRKTRLVLDARPSYHCPHCNEGLEFRDGQIVPWVQPSGEELTAKRAKFDEVEGKVESGLLHVKRLEGDFKLVNEKHRALLAEASEHRGKIKVLKAQTAYADKEEVSELDESEKSKAEEKVQRCASRLEAFELKVMAQQYHDNAVKTAEICELLGPNGARATHIAECMEKVRSVLAKIGMITGWLPIAVTQDYQVTSNGRPIQMVAKNEELKAQWALQIACAFYNKDAWIVLDEADTLRDEHWEGLVKLVGGLCEKNKGLRIVVCATSSKVDGWKVINLD